MKKQKAKKVGAKKKDDKEADVLASKDVDDAKEEVEAAEEEVAEVQGEKSALKKSHGRQPSVSVQSKLRSESFRKESPKSPIDGADLVQRVEELEKENRRLEGEKEDAEKRWHKLEDELQDVREADGDSAGLKEKVKLAEAHASELEKLVWHTFVEERYHITNGMNYRKQRLHHYSDKTAS